MEPRRLYLYAAALPLWSHAGCPNIRSAGRGKYRLAIQASGCASLEPLQTRWGSRQAAAPISAATAREWRSRLRFIRVNHGTLSSVFIRVKHGIALFDMCHSTAHPAPCSSQHTLRLDRVSTPSALIECVNSSTPLFQRRLRSFGAR